MTTNGIHSILPLGLSNRTGPPQASSGQAIQEHSGRNVVTAPNSSGAHVRSIQRATLLYSLSLDRTTPQWLLFPEQVAFHRNTHDSQEGESPYCGDPVRCLIPTFIGVEDIS